MIHAARRPLLTDASDGITFHLLTGMAAPEPGTCRAQGSWVGPGQALEAEMDLCPRCGSGFVLREPFVRAETLTRSEDPSFEVRVQTVRSGYFHLACAPWGDPKYRITRPERQPI